MSSQSRRRREKAKIIERMDWMIVSMDICVIRRYLLKLLSVGVQGDSAIISIKTGRFEGVTVVGIWVKQESVWTLGVLRNGTPAGRLIDVDG